MTSNFEPHRLFRIVPAMELDKFSFSAIAGARYHLEKIAENLNSAGMQRYWGDDLEIDDLTRRKLQANINVFHWHLRAFFWELVASFDTMLQWANQRFDLGLQEDKVKWEKIPRTAGKDQAEWDKKYAILESVWESSWYFEVRMYRNFAHRAFLFVQSEFEEQKTSHKSSHQLKMTWLLPVREGQQEYRIIMEQLQYYLERMRHLWEVLFKS